jgi:hypothetical protein
MNNVDAKITAYIARAIGTRTEVNTSTGWQAGTVTAAYRIDNARGAQVLRIHVRLDSTGEETMVYPLAKGAVRKM